MATFDRAGIAERLRGLLAGQDGGDLGKIAERLHIEEVSLRMSVDEDSPHPTVEVLAAVIREFGIDPGWLLTGDYCEATHRNAMEGMASITAELRAFVNRRSRLISEPPSENLHQPRQLTTTDLDQRDATVVARIVNSVSSTSG